MRDLPHFTPRAIIRELVAADERSPAQADRKDIVDPIFVNPAFHPDSLHSPKGSAE